MSSSGKDPPRPRGSSPRAGAVDDRATDPRARSVDPRAITPVEPLFDEATFVDKTDREPAPNFDDFGMVDPPFEDEGTDDTTTVGKGLEKLVERAALDRERLGDATEAAHRGAKKREDEPTPEARKVNKWSSTVMGQGPPPPTAEEIEAARRAEEAARGKNEESTSHSDAPSTKKRARFFTPSEHTKMMGRYELIAEIASGGMATVFLARLRGAGGFQRLVAIKRLHPHLQHEEDFIQMFLDEARIAAQIHHAHVVPILEIASSDVEGYYLVMEYIEGITLYDVAAHASAHKVMVPREIVLRIVLDTLSGLHAAHELIDADGTHLSVVHRDCTPSNMLVGIDGSTRLTDFGVARAASRLSSTLHGTLKGKVAYMAPEQVRRADYDHRADVFSMGVILWELLTQKRLFRADTKMETLNRVMTAPIPRVGQVAYGIPTSLETATSRALAREPSERFQSAIEMAEALEKAVGATIASPRQVAEFVQKHFGKSLAERRDAIRRWTDANEGREPIELVRRPRALPSVPPAARTSERPRAISTPAPARAPSVPPARGSDESVARKLAPNEPTVAKTRPRPIPPDVAPRNEPPTPAPGRAPTPAPPPEPAGEPILASPIISIEQRPPSQMVEHHIVSIDDAPTPGGRRVLPKMPEHRVSLSPAVVASMNEPPPSKPPPPADVDPEQVSQAGMSRLETYGLHEPTVLKARPRPAPEDDITLPTRSLTGYVFVAVVAVAVAALLLLGWTHWQGHDPTPATPTEAPTR